MPVAVYGRVDRGHQQIEPVTDLGVRFADLALEVADTVS
jgi:hypothetical protein